MRELAVVFFPSGMTSCACPQAAVEPPERVSSAVPAGGSRTPASRGMYAARQCTAPRKVAHTRFGAQAKVPITFTDDEGVVWDVWEVTRTTRSPAESPLQVS